MPKICYVKRKFSAESLAIIEKANEIITDMLAQGFDLTLRQLYYQFVSKAIIPNTERSYKNLGSIVNDGRLAGLIDWDHISDRTRFLRQNSHWGSPEEIIRGAAQSYKIDMWARQKYRPEVWIEKDALVGVIEGVCRHEDVPFFSCRGYTSQSEMWTAAMRLKEWAHGFHPAQTPIIFHLGDHDPSGKDMTRDVTERIELFMGGVCLERLALNMDQIEEYNPPPNPAKITDSRATAYIAEFGDSSWELDALEPRVIVDLVRKNVDKLKNKKIWAEDKARWTKEKTLLDKASKHWDQIAVKLEEGAFE
jgi:hypothetical protein